MAENKSSGKKKRLELKERRNQKREAGEQTFIKKRKNARTA